MNKFAKMMLGMALIITSISAAEAKVESRSPQNIVQIAAANGNFKTLVAAVQAAGLVGALSAPGPLTVFAPTDAAFAKLPPGTINALLADKAALTKILTYHVVANEYCPLDLYFEKNVKTLEGQFVRVSVEGGTQMLVINQSRVLAKPIYASNGVIYVIDTVLMP